MNENSENDNLNVLRKIQKNPKSSQRKLASDLGFSLGKLNYCLNRSLCRKILYLRKI